MSEVFEKNQEHVRYKKEICIFYKPISFDEMLK